MNSTVTYCGVRLSCEFDYEPAEARTHDHPGTPANAALTSCKVAGAEIMEMLSREMQDEIETKLCEQMEEGRAEAEGMRRNERLMEAGYP